MTHEIGDIEIDVFQVPNGWGYWFVSPYGNVVTRRNKTSAIHAMNAAKLALKYYTELPKLSGNQAKVVQPTEELEHTITLKNQILTYYTEYFNKVQKRRAIDRWALHNIDRISIWNLDPLPLSKDLLKYI